MIRATPTAYMFWVRTPASGSDARDCGTYARDALAKLEINGSWLQDILFDENREAFGRRLILPQPSAFAEKSGTVTKPKLSSGAKWVRRPCRPPGDANEELGYG